MVPPLVPRFLKKNTPVLVSTEPDGSPAPLSAFRLLSFGRIGSDGPNDDGMYKIEWDSKLDDHGKMTPVSFHRRAVPGDRTTAKTATALGLGNSQAVASPVPRP
jgi:hypothetical protein